ncbi:MAG: DUF3343 domain-containing protein [Clostridia bacterium]|nr:DUF3343 domain-containing protein [Clostridia bacterium]
MMILAVFRSRAHSLDYAERLHKYGVVATLESTPKEAKIGCGLCVRFPASAFARAQAILKVSGYSSFKGFYKTDFVNGKMEVTPYRK